MRILLSLKIVWRTFRSQVILSLINIVGLSVGFACFSLFLFYSINELTYDDFHANKENIYRAFEWSEGLPGSDASGEAGLYMPLGPALKDEFYPQDIENYVRVDKSFDEKLVKTDEVTIRNRITFADPQFFTIFSFNLVKGNATTALSDQRSAVVTEDKARQLFGDANVLGKIITIKVDETFEPFTITAVAEVPPSNSSIKFDIVLSYSYLLTTPLGKAAANNWRFSGFQNFLVLRKGSNLANEPERLAVFRERYFPTEKDELKQAGMWDGKSAYPISLRLQSLNKIHTDLKIKASGESAYDVKYIWILLSIAAGVLLIACINFVTLSIGRSTVRFKEIFIRRAFGSKRSGIFSQFLFESFLFSSLAATIGVLSVIVFLPYFKQLTGPQINFSLFAFPQLSWVLLAVVALVTVLAGSYPALVLSRLKTVDIVKNKVQLKGSNFFTKSLIVFQFCVSIVLLIGTSIMLQQVTYMRSKSLGFKKENVVVIDTKDVDAKKIYPLFKQAISLYPQIINVSSSDFSIGEGYNSTGFQHNGNVIQTYRSSIDFDHLKVMGVTLVAGRDLNANVTSDTVNSAIVNEALVRAMGLANDQAIGLRLPFYDDEKKNPVVIGVVKNFNFLPLQEAIKPLLLRHPPDFHPSKYFIRINSENTLATLDIIQKNWNTLVPNIPLQFSFLDQNLDALYNSEKQQEAIVRWAAIIAVSLACLGLFGLAALSTVNRTKEIGIRKVNGASTMIIIGLLSKDFLKLVLIAFVIASPIAWYVGNQWLENYVNRIHVSWLVFASTGLISLLIGFITVSFHIIKAANSNPAITLRNE
jgi:putative ABC transport system permease protein